MKYFTNCRTLDELKKEFRRLCMIHHPDRGGDTATMAAINAEYEALFPALKLAYNRTAETPTTETAESYRSEFYTRNGWKGSNYESGRSLKEIAQHVRRFIKEQFPTYKFSVRTHYASMCQELLVDMKEAPCKIFKDFEELTEDDKHDLLRRMRYNNVFTLDSWYDHELKAEFERIWTEHGDWYRCVSDQLKATAEAVDSYVNSFNRSDCDGMIDYFDVNFYYFGCLQDNGRRVAYVPRTARITAQEAPKWRDKHIAEDITRLESVLEALRDYRKDLAARYGELETMPYTRLLKLERHPHWKGHIEYIVTITRKYSDKTEIDELREVYSGKERKKAFDRTAELLKQNPGIPYEKNIEKRSWER